MASLIARRVSARRSPERGGNRKIARPTMALTLGKRTISRSSRGRRDSARRAIGWRTGSTFSSGIARAVSRDSFRFPMRSDLAAFRPKQLLLKPGGFEGLRVVPEILQAV